VVGCDRYSAVECIGSAKQEDAQIFAGEWAGDGEVVGVHCAIIHMASDIGGLTFEKSREMRVCDVRLCKRIGPQRRVLRSPFTTRVTSAHA